MRTLLRAVLPAVFAAGLSLSVVPSVATASPGTATVTVVHGLRGVVADVSLDGRTILRGFSPMRSTDPFQLPAGTHRVEVRKAGAPESSPPVLGLTAPVTAGANLTLVVHAGVGGKPEITVYRNDVSSTGPARSRLVVREAADAPAARVTVDGRRLPTALSAGASATADVPAGGHTVALAAADTGDALIAPRSVPTTAGSATFLYLTGSAADDSLGWLVQTVNGLGGAPAGVPTGNSGLAADRDHGASSAALPLALLLAGGAAVTAGRRRPSRRAARG